jgi:hypothetical protein
MILIRGRMIFHLVHADREGNVILIIDSPKGLHPLEIPLVCKP